jgi:hypothetical protein
VFDGQNKVLKILNGSSKVLKVIKILNGPSKVPEALNGSRRYLKYLSLKTVPVGTPPLGSKTGYLKHKRWIRSAPKRGVPKTTQQATEGSQHLWVIPYWYLGRTLTKLGCCFRFSH